MTLFHAFTLHPNNWNYLSFYLTFIAINYMLVPTTYLFAADLSMLPFSYINDFIFATPFQAIHIHCHSSIPTFQPSGPKTVAELTKMNCDKFVAVSLQAKILASSDTVCYRNREGQDRSLFKVVFADNTGAIMATVYNPALKNVLRPGSSVVAINFMPKGSSILLTSGSKVSR